MSAVQAVLIGVDVFAVWNVKACIAHALEGGVNTATPGAGSQTDVSTASSVPEATAALPMAKPTR